MEDKEWQFHCPGPVSSSHVYGKVVVGKKSYGKKLLTNTCHEHSYKVIFDSV